MRSNELIFKSREAMMSAVQIYNNPQVSFKSESFISLGIISWTYLMHAYFKIHKVDYRYFHMKGKKKTYDRTKYGAYKYWELEKCLAEMQSPIDGMTKHNLEFLIGIRHEIEHQMTKKIDESISAKLQACSINFNYYIKKLFGDRFGVDQELGLAIQFSPIEPNQEQLIFNNDKLLNNIHNFIIGFEENLTDEELIDSKYAYRVLFTRLSANRKGQADQVIEFLSEDSQAAEDIIKTYTLVKETEKIKYYPMQVVDLMKNKGYIHFGIHHHSRLWRCMNVDLKKAGYGVFVGGNKWMWYEKWTEYVEAHCKENSDYYINKIGRLPI